VHLVTVDPYWVEIWIADHVRSAKTIKSEAVLAEFDEVCSVLEAACRQHTPRVHAVPQQ
jgi:hypothetical protein